MAALLYSTAERLWLCKREERGEGEGVNGVIQGLSTYTNVDWQRLFMLS